MTAGNSCGVNDGACAVLVMEEGQALSWVINLSFVSFVSVVSGSQSSRDWSDICVNRLLNEMNVKVEDIDYFEINEAFASKVVACAKRVTNSV